MGNGDQPVADDTPHRVTRSSQWVDTLAVLDLDELEWMSIAEPFRRRARTPP